MPGVSGRAFLEALIPRESNTIALEDLARGRLRAKSRAVASLSWGNFTEHRATLLRLHLDRTNCSTTTSSISMRLIDALITEHDQLWDREPVATMPGISTPSAVNILAQIGADMTASRHPHN